MTDQNKLLNMPVLYADRVNKNKRVYTMRLVERLCLENQPVVRDRRLMCTLDSPIDSIVDLKSVCGVVSRLWMEGPVLKADVELTDTPCGMVVKNILKSGPNVALRTAGIGSGKVNDDGHLIINNDYKLVSLSLHDADKAS